MTTESIARLFERSRRYGKGWRARCPVHQSKGLTLGIYAGDTATIVHCFAGCEPKDILASVGLSFKDTYYQQRDPKAMREAERQRRIEEAAAYRQRIREWIKLFQIEGYNTRDEDTQVAAATSIIMAVDGEKPHLQRILKNHMERLAAADIIGL